jgi:hypothetical protein
LAFDWRIYITLLLCSAAVLGVFAAIHPARKEIRAAIRENGCGCNFAILLFVYGVAAGIVLLINSIDRWSS